MCHKSRKAQGMTKETRAASRSLQDKEKQKVTLVRQKLGSQQGADARGKLVKGVRRELVISLGGSEGRQREREREEL